LPEQAAFGLSGVIVCCRVQKNRSWRIVAPRLLNADALQLCVRNALDLDGRL
jgi:hypothetical protein